MDPAWIGVIGAVVGGGLVFLTAIYRAKRQQTADLNARRLATYATFLSQALVLRSPAEWIVVGRLGSLAAQKQAALRSLAEAYALVNLIAGRKVKGAADALAERPRGDITAIAGTLTMFRRIPEPLDEASNAEFMKLRVAFEHAVRRELHLGN